MRPPKTGHRPLEPLADIALVADHDLAPAQRARQELERHLALSLVGPAQLGPAGSAVEGADKVQAHAPEKARVAAAPAITAAVAQGRAAHRLQRSSALDRGRVEQHQVIVIAGALGGEDARQPVDRLAQGAAALVVARLAGDRRKQMPEPDPGHGQKAPVGRDAHGHLSDGQGHHLGVVDLSPGIGRPMRQEIVGGDINRGAEGVEVGVHRGLRVDGAIATADFGPSAPSPFTTARSVESII